MPNPHGQIPISTFIGDPDKTGGVDVENLRLGYEFKHRFNDHLSLRQNLGFFRVEQSWAHGLYNAVLGDDLRTLYVTPFNYQNGVIKRTMVDTAVDFTFETGDIKHTVTAGVDYFYSHNRSRYQDIDYDDFPGSYVAIDLLKPDHDFTLPDYSVSDEFNVREHSLGFYLQEYAELTEKLTVTLGGRYDYLWLDDTGSWGNSAVKATDHAFTPKAGITYEFVTGTAVYANYSRAFQPQWTVRDAAGAAVPSEHGVNLEMGIKYSLLDDKITGPHLRLSPGRVKTCQQQ